MKISALHLLALSATIGFAVGTPVASKAQTDQQSSQHAAAVTVANQPINNSQLVTKLSAHSSACAHQHGWSGNHWDIVELEIGANQNEVIITTRANIEQREGSSRCRFFTAVARRN